MTRFQQSVMHATAALLVAFFAVNRRTDGQRVQVVPNEAGRAST